MPRRDLLARDGLYWGINLHAFDGNQALGDLRIWRGRKRRAFGMHNKQLLDLIEPAFAPALPLPAQAAFSQRELQVLRCVGRGLMDKEIARELDIALPSVRAYVQRLFEKTRVHRRSWLGRFVEGCEVVSLGTYVERPERDDRTVSASWHVALLLNLRR